MAKRELSSTLRNLKFMQRAASREENKKKEEEFKSDGNFCSPSTINRKCVVIMEGDPHPGAIKGRMSFQSFNPSIDKLTEAAENTVSATSFDSKHEELSFREDADGAGCSNVEKSNCKANGDLKRKQLEVVYDTKNRSKLPKDVQGSQQSSPNNSKGSFKKPKDRKLDWSVL
ncbi:hypothetical protein I3843_13G078200 [Carya illinoinensis]|uniref:M-phase phosphoprotein 6 n=1 Tax=Carya illinoinensis TaxID=32201 RepID=A0A8T1NP06_CARIL|nr:uncharacterized protein LOC122292360 [Carya illinoinensis]KAG6631441.1 hypothetical protein CIPAW_13G091800 [Carya illinoinensis]KAG7949746.1 hypothetical protein I3843_13G078200 [Carya illinoinensis]